MELEFRHLAPYLSYELNGIASFLEDTIFVVDTLNIRTLRVIGETKFGNNVPLGCFLKDFKPILRPLSDLTKELFMNGNYGFVPAKRLANDYLNTSYWGTNSIGTGILDKERNMVSLCFIENEILGECPYMIYQNLCEWHFDIFNLISQGLAIDINTMSANGS